MEAKDGSCTISTEGSGSIQPGQEHTGVHFVLCSNRLLHIKTMKNMYSECSLDQTYKGPCIWHMTLTHQFIGTAKSLATWVLIYRHPSIHVKYHGYA